MKIIYSIFVMLLSSVSLMAQNAMRVHYKDGTEQDIYLSQIDSVTFTDKEVPEETAMLTGDWLWVGREAGYYELLTFNEDHTYTGYDKYFMYGFDTMTYGWYVWYGNMLTLQSNGFGYQRRYNWLIVGLSDNALEVVTKMGIFTYYRLQTETIYISTAENYDGFTDDESIVFADGVVVKAKGSELRGLIPGTTYVLVRKTFEERIVAYKVIVR